MSKKIRVAMCGVGRWGPNLLRNLRQHPGFEVAAIADGRPERLEEFRDFHPEARLYSSVEEVAKDASLQAAVVATPAGLHEEHVSLLMDAGKDVLVEKPLAMSLSGGRQLVAQAERQGRVLMAGHTFLFNPAVVRTKKAIESGDLGELQLVQAQRMSLGQVRSDCNALWNLAPHDVSILLYWLGQMPSSVTAKGIAFHEHQVQEDIAFCILEFPGRVMASIQVSWMNPVKVRSMTVVGSGGMLVYDDTSAEKPLELFEQHLEEVPERDPSGSFDRFRLHIRKGASRPLIVPEGEPLAEEIQHFHQALCSREMPRGSGVEALRVISVLEALDKSLKNGGTPVVPENVERVQ